MGAVEIVRVYCTEHEPGLEPILRILHDECAVRGATGFRGIAGFGDSGHIHEARWTDLSLDLPLVVEFFDSPERAAAARACLRRRLSGIRMAWWQANLEEAGEAAAGPTPSTD